MRFLTAFAAALSALVLGSCSTMSSITSMFTSNDDPYLWLEEVEGERALTWVREQNARSLPQLQGDARYAQLHASALAIANSHDRLALGEVRDGYLYNFWQDETNIRGLWRRSPLAAYSAGQPQWETLLDVDALARAENANWVYKGVDCLDGTTRCMVSLSDGGKDATTWREFDTATRQFVQGGFVLPEAKSSLAWIDADTLLVGTDWGAGTMTESGYAFVLKRWARGAPLASATEVMRGQATDVGVFAASLQDTDGQRLIAGVEADTFFESTFWRLDGATPQRVNLPPRSTVQGVHKGNIVFTLEEAWRGLPQGALAAYPLADTGAEAPHATVLFAPNARQSIEAVTFSRDAVLIAATENVRGRIVRLAFDGRAWVESQIDLPPNGAVSFAGASPTSSEAFAVFEDFLTPETLYALEERATRARAVRSLPAQFDATRFVSEQFEATSRDGTRVPYFVIRARDQQANGQNPTLLYAYGGFQVSMTPAYSGYVGRMWLENGGTYVLANIRGGGEFGPAWHQAGLKTNRQVIYDDFFAIEQDLVDPPYHEPAPPRHHGWFERRVADGRDAQPAPGDGARSSRSGAAARHAALRSIARGRIMGR